MPVTLTAPAVSSTVTVPAWPWNTAKVGLGWKRPFRVPSALVQFMPSVRHVPTPPSIALLSRSAALLPSQKLSVAPAVDISETSQAYLIKAELAGVKREDIQVKVEGGQLRLSGERKFDNEVKKEQYHRIERSYGSFSRSFSLPATVDSTRIAAEFKNGVLTIRLPFREEAKPRSVTIDVA